MRAQLDNAGSDERRLDEFAAAIDRDAEVPIGLQLGWALSARIYDGEFRPGQRLPGLRELAEASGLNVNTVRAVYQRLEQRGLLESHQGSGTFVARTLPRPSAVGTIAADAAREAEAIGVDPREVAAALYVAVPQGPPSTPDTQTPGSASADMDEQTGGAVARRRALRAQIATLERAIGEIEAEYPGVAPRSTNTRRGPGPTLLSSEELEQVRSALVRRLAQVQIAIDGRRAVVASRGESTQNKTANARPRARARAGGQTDNTSTADSDSAPTSPKRPGGPRSTSRPAAAGT